MKGQTSEKFGVYINGINYSYLVSKSEKDKEKLIIKLYDESNKINIYYTYSGDINKLKRDINFLDSFDKLDDIISCLNDIFNKGNAQVEDNHGKYYLKLNYIKLGMTKSSIIPLIRDNNKNEENNEFEDRINKIENNYKDLFNKYEELKIKKDEDIKKIVKETLFDDDIQKKLFEKMENMFLSKYNLNNIHEKQNQNDNIDNNIINKINEVVYNKEDKINKQIDIIQKQLNENINYLNELKSNNTNNYIILQIKIDEKDLNKDIRLFNQVRTYKYFCNFEKDDIEVIIDNQIVNIKYKNKYGDFKYNKKSKNCELAQQIEYNLNPRYEYYWNFTTRGMHTVKIIFKKKLLQCNYLFGDCTNIYRIDCSNFDCSQIIDCSWMFGVNLFVSTSLIEINLGKLDFSLSNDFSDMFYGCKNLEKLDVSYLNTNNSKSFWNMFCECSKLKEINVSKFKALNCEDIRCMFCNCSSLESIDMLNWDMNSMNKVDYLFDGCSKLKNIKMNYNNNIKLSFEGIFLGLPEDGSFVYKKGNNCEEILKELPKSWKITQE